MAQPGYLHRWIGRNFQRVWKKRKSPPRILGERRAYAVQQNSFLELGRMLVSRFAAMIPKEKTRPILFEILDMDDVGAWVVWPDPCYGVLISKGLVRKLQRICWHSVEIFPAFDAPVKKSNFLAELWADLPRDEPHLYHFGSLIGHIAFAFIIHHELAHAGLGHQNIGAVLRKEIGNIRSGGVTDECSEFIDEFAGVLGQTFRSDASLTSQALETDADVHGAFYTRSLIHEEADLIHEGRGSDNKPMYDVWKTLLRDRDSEQLMLFIGISVGLLALLPNMEEDRIDIKKEGASHPPLPSRLLLVFHVIGSIDNYNSKYWENRSAAITTTIILMNLLQKTESGGTPAVRVASSDAADPNGDEERTPALSQDSMTPREKWQTLSHLSIVDAMLRSNDLASYWEELVSRMRLLSPILGKSARLPDYLRYEWFMSTRKSNIHSKKDGTLRRSSED